MMCVHSRYPCALLHNPIIAVDCSVSINCCASMHLSKGVTLYAAMRLTIIDVLCVCVFSSRLHFTT